MGIAFGILARKAGLTPFDVGLMSLLVYAGASQFLAVEMLLKGTAGISIVIATFFLNLRHLLMSSHLSLFLKKARLFPVTLLSAQLTDESFAVAVSTLDDVKEDRPQYLFGLQITSHLAWLAGSVAGAFFGSLVKSTEYGFPFALPAMFICLLVFQIKSSLHFLMIFVAGISALIFRWLIPGNWYIVLAALVTAGIGIAVESEKERSRAK